MEETQTLPRPIGLFISIFVWFCALFWLISTPDYEPAITLIGATVAIVVLLLKKKSPHKTSRQILIEKVKAYWIHGVLEKSFHQGKQIDLVIKYKPDAVDRSWMMNLAKLNESDRTSQTSENILDIFERFAGRMLILGSPGSGKTTLLLSLAKDLLESDKYGNQPIPVVFNLSSWKKEQNIEDWLADEFENTYQVKKEFAIEWLKSDSFRLLLDGLDEVREKEREKCVQAINQFSQNYQHSIVISSRIHDYEELATKLKLAGAILIQPLTREQVDNYLGSEGEEFTTLRLAMNTDALLRELSQSPLMLNILSSTYDQMSLPDLQAGNLNERRQRLFDNYIQRTLRHQEQEKDEYSSSLRWLVILARTMTYYNKERFSLEWNPFRRILSHHERAQVNLLFNTFLVVICIGYSLCMGKLVSNESGFMIGIVSSFILLLITIFVVFSYSTMIEGEDHANEMDDIRMAYGGEGILVLGALFSLWFGMSILLSIIVGLIIGKILAWPIGLLTAIIFLWFWITRFGNGWGIKPLLAIGTGLITWLFFLLSGGESSLGLFATILLVGFIIKITTIRLFFFRLFIYQKGYFPLNYIDFFNNISRQITYKLGNDYIFAHPLLMKHFAELEIEGTPELAKWIDLFEEV